MGDTVPTWNREDLVSIDVKLSVDMTPELAERFIPRLREEIRRVEGDMRSSDEPFDVETADLASLVARAFDRQCSPLSLLNEVADSDMFDDYATFGKVLEFEVLDEAPEA
jgi:hypothetical protein